jgi:hypothetical protein
MPTLAVLFISNKLWFSGGKVMGKALFIGVQSKLGMLA